MLPGKQATCKRCQALGEATSFTNRQHTLQNKQTRQRQQTTSNRQQATGNGQRATCNTQLQPSAAINGRQSNGEAARIKSTGASTVSQVSQPAPSSAFPDFSVKCCQPVLGDFSKLHLYADPQRDAPAASTACAAAVAVDDEQDYLPH